MRLFRQAGKVRWPMRFMHNFAHNARVIIPMEAIWAVFSGMLLFFMPVYMREIGLTNIQIGLVNTIGLTAGCITIFFAAPLTNKYGRRKTLIIFDILTWGPSMLLWALAQNTWYFAAAVVFSAIGKIAYVAWTCLMIEDSPPESRAGIFGAISTIVSLSAMTTPISAFLFTRYQIVPTMRFLFVLGGICMLTMFLVRHWLVHETAAGQALIDAHQDRSVWQGLSRFVRDLPAFWKTREKALFSLIYVINNYIMAFSVFTVIFFKEQLLFNESVMSLSPVISGLLNLLLVFGVVPRLRALGERKSLAAAFVLSAAGILLLILIPQRSIPWFVATILLTASGSYLTTTFRDTAFMNSLGEHEKADAFSVVQTLGSIAAIPAGILAGYLYSQNPRLLFAMVIVLHLTGLVLSGMLLKIPGQKPASARYPAE